MSEEITKRKVTMRNKTTTLREDGSELTVETSASDYVRPDFLDAYVTDAKTRWQYVEVSDKPDAGPGGYHGQTVIPAHLDHPEAGAVFAATNPKGK